MTRTCTDCHRTLPLDAFPLVNGKYRRRRCRDCWLALQQAYREAHRTEQNERNRTYYEANSEAIKGYAKSHGKKRREQTRQQVFEHYGRSCACCGESEDAFLCLDHVDGGGNKHRQSLGPAAIGSGFYFWIVRQGFPTGFQTLCWNCNSAKHQRGACPHQEVI
jgi:hypothetical protein